MSFQSLSLKALLISLMLSTASAQAGIIYDNFYQELNADSPVPFSDTNSWEFFSSGWGMNTYTEYGGVVGFDRDDYLLDSLSLILANTFTGDNQAESFIASLTLTLFDFDDNGIGENALWSSTAERSISGNAGDSDRTDSLFSWDLNQLDLGIDRFFYMVSVDQLAQDPDSASDQIKSLHLAAFDTSGQATATTGEQINSSVYAKNNWVPDWLVRKSGQPFVRVEGTADDSGQQEALAVPEPAALWIMLSGLMVLMIRKPSRLRQ